MLKNLVIFTISDQEFAADIHKISLILKPNEVFRSKTLSSSPLQVSKAGITEIKLLDLHSVFNLPSHKIYNTTRVLIVENKNKIWGFLVDKVKEIVSVEIRYLGPEIYKKTEETHKKGLPFSLPAVTSDNQKLVMLDLEKLMADDNHEFYRFAKIQTNVSK